MSTTRTSPLRDDPVPDWADRGKTGNSSEMRAISQDENGGGNPSPSNVKYGIPVTGKGTPGRKTYPKLSS